MRKAQHVLLKWLFSSPSEPVDFGAVFLWWESRRPVFNLIIGTYGICCLIVFFIAIWKSGILTPGEDAVEPIALMAAPIVINVLYTLGWIVEGLGRSLDLHGELSPRFGPRLLMVGLSLGLFLSSVPAVYWVGYVLFQQLGLIASTGSEIPALSIVLSVATKASNP
jgi:hypothetical protein